jgi:2-phospho-L-lactate transferase/gluconeogenesis factor (CofD/UPF0052 family)
MPPTHSQVRTLLGHRLSSSPGLAAEEWQDIVAGTSTLWIQIAPPERELIRSILNHVNAEILKRARPPASTFNFSSASIGNLFLTGARLFTGSCESAVYLMGVVGGIQDGTNVIPSVNSNFSHHISAKLEDGTTITGQNAISHPSEPTALPDRRNSFLLGPSGANEEPDPEDANLPGSLPTLRKQNILFSKTDEEALTSRIERIWYINPYGQEIRPAANAKAVGVIRQTEAVIYSIGSLYTSIVPCLILRGIGEAIASSPGLRFKILMLNGSLDRESGPPKNPMTALDFVAAIARAGEESRGRLGTPNREMWSSYVTHVIYLEGEGVPKVNRTDLLNAGIECVRCWGRKSAGGSMCYDPAGLTGAFEAILGRGEGKGERIRRNTLEG